MREGGELSVSALALYVPISSVRLSRFGSRARQVVAAALYLVTESHRLLPQEPRSNPRHARAESWFPSYR